jgi:hypothetical protein
MIRFPVLATSALVLAVGCGVAACPAETRIAQQASGQKNATAQAKSRKVRIALVGYFVLPIDYRVYRTNELRDAWSGYILSPDQCFRINWSAGLVQSPFENGEDGFVWVKREEISNGFLKYGVKRFPGGEQIAATVGFANFYAQIKTEHDQEQFMQIVRSYSVEQCDDCERPLTEPQSNNTSGQHGG